MNRQQAEHILDAYVQTVKFMDDYDALLEWLRGDA